jgi:rhomboid family GlyGly-CTERM serine protease
VKSLRPVLLLYAVPALLVALVPGAPGALLYDRDAVWRGELWRLWTDHWVHFSASHLGWNLLVLLAAGTWLEKLQPGLLLRYTLLAAPGISVGFLALAPDMQVYGGLSGLAAGVVTLLALIQLACGGGDRARWLAVLCLVAAKLLLEAGRDQALFSHFPATIHSSALAHAAGAGLALVFFLSRLAADCLPLSGAPHPAPILPRSR